ncbi:hypothetical protein GN956_G15341 [Arapaima gigas]
MGSFPDSADRGLVMETHSTYLIRGNKLLLRVRVHQKTPPDFSAHRCGQCWWFWRRNRVRLFQDREWMQDGVVRLERLKAGGSLQLPRKGTLIASIQDMLRQILLNSTADPSFDAMAQTHAPSLNISHGPVSVSAWLRPTGRGLREGELPKPDLATYVVIFLVLLLLVLFIVFYINCQLRGSFFASMPYDRSLRETRGSYK